MDSPAEHDADIKAIDDIARALVRPIVTVLFAAAFIAFTWIGLISGEVFSAIAGTVIAFWFSSRNQDKQDAALQHQTQALVDIVKTSPTDVILPHG